MSRSRISAGLLMYRRSNGRLEVLLAHPGGPFFAGKDHGCWSIPKGEPGPDEDLLLAARREFYEEIGFPAEGEVQPLGTVTQKGGKVVHAWAIAGDPTCPLPQCGSRFDLEWPPGSGRVQQFPEVDQAGFFSVPEARRKLKESQHPFLDRLQETVGA